MDLSEKNLPLQVACVLDISITGKDAPASALLDVCQRRVRGEVTTGGVEVDLLHF